MSTPRTHSILPWVLALACLALPAMPSMSAENDDPQTDQPPIEAHEEYDNSAPTFSARDDILARSRGMRVGVGAYVSVQANVDELGQNIIGDAANEPSIAVNPTNPDNIIIGWRQFDTITNSFRQGGWSYSFDRGQSWTFPGVLTPGVFRSDPVLDFDSQGNAYYQSLKQTFDMDVFKSIDGGATWSAPVFSFGGDKNWMVIDHTGGPGDGHIYGTWQRAVGCCNFDILTRSVDGGQSYESPVPITLSPGLGTMAVGPDGELYSAGIDESFGQDINTIVVARSDNARNAGTTPTFTGTVVNLGGGLGFSQGPNPSGLLGQVNIATDHSDGPSRGNAYILASVSPFGPGNPIDVHLVRSVDGGANWTAPIRVNDDAPNNGAYHWLGALSVAANGRLDAIWADTRNSGQSNVSELFYSYSYDQGDSWSPNVAVSPSFNSSLGWPQQNKMGDYFTLISDAAGADAAYAATFNGEQDVYYIRLFPDCNGNARSDVVDIDDFGASDCNSNSIPDTCEIAVDCNFAGATPDGATFNGTPLTMSRAGGSVGLSWGNSCQLADNDYEVYEGNLGDLTSHTPRQCSTNNQTTLTLVPRATSSYFLVVPRNDLREGSYGVDSDGAQRPDPQAACEPQQFGPCLDFPSF